MSNADLKKLITEYSLDYCHFLEAVYGEGMMSEGGAEAIELMFQAVVINNKTALDIGSGLGGVAIYLAKTFNISVVGIDINPAMVMDAQQRIPQHLISKISFQVYDDIAKLPFSDKHFDIVYSKGVLTHVRDKLPLFQEVARILKPQGKFIINDWLSPVDDKWGDAILKMCEMENLTLYAVCAENYRKLLQQAGFNILSERSETAEYAAYNQKQVDWLKEPQHATAFKAQFGEQAWQEAWVAYQLIADSMKNEELLVKNFVVEMYKS